MNLTNSYKAHALEDARRIYGNRNQICVATEELCELASVLSKYPRYDTDAEAIAAIRGKVLDEFADVTIVLEHVREIFGFRDTEIHMAQEIKIDRLERWLKNDDSGSMRQTTIDRTVSTPMTDEEMSKVMSMDGINTFHVSAYPDCESCYYWEHFSELIPEKCADCVIRHKEKTMTE